MHLFRPGKQNLTDDELRERLFDLVAQKKRAELARMLQQHSKRIRALMLAWKTVPEGMRSDPRRAQRWANGVIGIAAGYEALGDRSLILQLMGRRITR